MSVAKTALDEASDADLVAATRDGDGESYAELWRRHARAAHAAARHFTSIADPDDLVAEAYTRILASIRRGAGPTGPFRPYLYSTVRNLARRLSGDEAAILVEDFDVFAGSDSDPVDTALDRTLTVAAFRSLPERWRTVLWYTEVEELDPHEVAPLLGTTANGAAAIAYRAREGLRRAWLQMHVRDENTPPECRWTVQRLGRYERGGLTAAETTRLEDHLVDCARCTAIAAEVRDVAARLAIVVGPLVLGAGAGTLLAALHAAPAGAATAGAALTGVPLAGAPIAVPALPGADAVHAAAAFSRAARAPSGVVAGTAIVLAATATALTLWTAPPAPAPVAATSPHMVVSPTPDAVSPTPAPVAAPEASPAPVPAPRASVPPPPAAPVAPTPPPAAATTAPPPPVITTVIAVDAALPPSLAGTALPGARIVVVDDHGTQLAVTTASATGAWATGHLTALSPAATSIRVTQSVGGPPSAPATTGPLSFVPSIVSPASPAHCPAGGSMPIQVVAWPGTAARASVDAGAPVTVTSTGITTLQLVCGTGHGPHEIRVSYAGASATATLRVVVTG